ncbi:MAG: hypothetical protein NTY48_02145 [Candidatus Diapherotrites archaeon]|nr:hypothetical protein [Candidatus Diapherotrites archaeon]
MLPKRIERVRAKRTLVKYDATYFEEHKVYFKPSFMRRSPLERSRILAKVYKNAALTDITLRKIRTHLREIAGKDYEKKDIEKVRRRVQLLDYRAERLLADLYEKNREIFSGMYFDRLGYGRGGEIVNEHMRLVHECIHTVKEIGIGAGYTLRYLS